jgi:multicomponent Na+:H+ antiporter subunit E
MSWFLAHLLFSLLWASLLGAFDFLTLLSGFALGLLLFRLTLNKPSLRYRKRFYSFVRFGLFYLREILVSNFKIALDVVRGRPRIQPGIVMVNVEKLSPRAKVVVANLITMTPGTLSLDISEDDRHIYVHCLYLQEPEQVRQAMEKDYVDAIAALNQPIQP